MNLNITYDSNTLNSAPSGFFSAVNYVVGLFNATFTNNVTVNIEIGYGTFPYDNSTVPALGESEQNGLVWGNYSQVRQALINEAVPGASTLLSSSPLRGNLAIDSAQEKALGLIGASTTLDGWVGIASEATLSQQIGGSWSYSATATPANNQYYLVGVLEHEITEIMGRTSYLDVRGEYGVMDLYRYRSAGVHQTGTGSPAYFSTDGGTTNLDNWNTLSGGDIGDWANSTGADAFLAFSPPGQVNSLGTTDVTLMEALGWTVSAASVSVPAPHGLVLSSSSDSGIKYDAVTNVNTPVIFGSGVAGDTVTLRDAGTTVGSGTVGSDGVWWAATSKLTPGAHSLTATQTSGLGFASPASAAFNLTIVAPQPDQFNGNGTSDILFQDTGSGFISQFQMQNGQPTWKTIGWAPSNWQIAGTGDFNGDGTSDILLKDPSSGFVSQFQMQNGQPSWKSIGWAPSNWQVAGTGDFNGDGTSDILLRDSAGNVSQFEMQNGQATWQYIGWASPDSKVADTGDFNADGTSDILFSDPTTGLLGEFEMHNGQENWKGLGSAPSGYTVAGVGDFHGDGYSDILLHNSTTGDVAELRTDSGMTFADIGWAPSGWEVAGTGDYNGDGTTDILFKDPSSGFTSQFQISDGHATWSNVGWAPANWTIHT
jgi:hypothetical protein